MLYLVKKTRENVSTYNRSTKGVEIIQKVKDLKDAYGLVEYFEDSDFFPQDDGSVLRAAGSECFDPNYPDVFDFLDYAYHVQDIKELDEYSDAHIIRAFKAAGVEMPAIGYGYAQ
jgi:hypothetical protein